jgi:hypothetical protein
MPARQARLDVRDVLEVLHHVACGDPAMWWAVRVPVRLGRDRRPVASEER